MFPTKPKCFALLAILFCRYADYDPPVGYYNAAQGKTGEALRQALHSIIKGHTVISYANTHGALEILDQDPTNSDNVILIGIMRGSS